jgi:hypothetical protein
MITSYTVVEGDGGLPWIVAGETVCISGKRIPVAAFANIDDAMSYRDAKLDDLIARRLASSGHKSYEEWKAEIIAERRRGVGNTLVSMATKSSIAIRHRPE